MKHMQKGIRKATLHNCGDNVARAVYFVYELGRGIEEDSPALPALRQAWALCMRLEHTLCEVAPLLGADVRDMAWGAPDMPDGPVLL